MSPNPDFKKEWEKTKKQLIKFGKEATEIAQKGEKEIVEFSRKSKIQIDSTALQLKKEKLYYLIGKEYVKSKDSETPSTKLNKLVADLKKAEKSQNSLKSKLKKSAK